MPTDLLQEFWLYLNKEKEAVELIALILTILFIGGSTVYSTYVIIKKSINPTKSFTKKIHTKLRQKPSRNTPSPDPSDTPISNAIPPEPEIRSLSDEYCPLSGPYYIFEHPELIQSFTKGEKMPRHRQGTTLKTVTWIYIPAAQLAQRKSNFIPPAKSSPSPEQPQAEKYSPALKNEPLRTPDIRDHIIFNILEHIQETPHSPNFSDVPGVSSNSELTHHIDHCIRKEYISGAYNSARRIALFSITPKGQALLAKLAFHRQSMPNILREICQMLDKKYGRYLILNFEDIPGNHDKQTIITNIQNGISQKYIEGTYDEDTETAQIKLTQLGIQELEKI